MKDMINHSIIAEMSNRKHIITLSESALTQLNFILSKEKNKGKAFRIKVIGGGCSGFQYQFSVDKKTGEDSLYSYSQNIILILDEASIPFLKGAILDYTNALIGSSFQIKNPNADASCSCGSSFSI